MLITLKNFMVITQKYSGNFNNPMTPSNQKIDTTSYKTFGDNSMKHKLLTQSTNTN